MASIVNVRLDVVAPLAARSASVTGAGTQLGGSPSPVIAHSSMNGASGRSSAPSRRVSRWGIRGATLPSVRTSSVHVGRMRVSATVCGSPGPQSKASSGVRLPPTRAIATDGLKKMRRIVFAATRTSHCHRGTGCYDR